MPNKNYQKGLRKEYKICKQYRNLGYDIVQRTAGSHSPVDVFAIDKKNKNIVFIQAKPDSMSVKQKEKLLKEQEDLKGKYKIYFFVI